MKQSNLKKISRNDYLIYKEKAVQALKTMELAYNAKLWAASAREAVFACINSADALLAKYAGMRNISKNHMDVVDLISKGNYLKIESAKNQANRLRKVIAQKNLADYENKPFNEKKASDIRINATKFFDWAMDLLEK